MRFGICVAGLHNHIRIIMVGRKACPYIKNMSGPMGLYNIVSALTWIPP